jgi:nicotinamide mononucleotide transporter
VYYFFSIQNIAFSLFGYPVSVVELIGVVFGLASVWLAATANRLTWYVGLVSQIAYFALFYQYQLYSDMFLQVFFTVFGLYGMFAWRNEKSDTLGANTVGQITGIGFMNQNQRVFSIIGIVFLTLIWGFTMQKLPVLLPQYFPQPTSAPYLDGTIGVLSVFAAFYQTKKYVEFWWLYIVVDILATGLYFYKNIPFSGLLYAVFLIMAVVGARKWAEMVR